MIRFTTYLILAVAGFCGLVAAVALAGYLLAAPARAEPRLIVCESPGLIDGDTMVCAGERVRLWGIQAPERADPGGPAATRALAEITKGQTVICIARGRSYERVVAQCFVGDMDVAGEMVRRGQAVDWPKFSRGHYAGIGR
ncbi:thermonuclease family protein [Phenylobacterium sp.]|uniref:thermonuclease family protein n=1 Tax=Phenylobacterium sp. TaxID=1871053 RepID=UPI002FCA1676